MKGKWLQNWASVTLAATSGFRQRSLGVSQNQDIHKCLPHHAISQGFFQASSAWGPLLCISHGSMIFPAVTSMKSTFISPWVGEKLTSFQLVNPTGWLIPMNSTWIPHAFPGCHPSMTAPGDLSRIARTKKRRVQGSLGILKALVKDHLRGVVLAGDWAANQYFGMYIYIYLCSYIYIYIHTHMYNSLELSYPKRVLQNIPLFKVKTRFSFGCIVGGFWRWVVDGFWYLRVFYGIFTGFRRLRKTRSSSKQQGVRCHNSPFSRFWLKKKLVFESHKTHFFPRDGSHSRAAPRVFTKSAKRLKVCSTAAWRWLDSSGWWCVDEISGPKKGKGWRRRIMKIYENVKIIINIWLYENVNH